MTAGELTFLHFPCTECVTCAIVHCPAGPRNSGVGIVPASIRRGHDGYNQAQMTRGAMSADGTETPSDRPKPCS